MGDTRELTCRVAEGYRVVWDVYLFIGGIVRSEYTSNIARVRNEGVTIEMSSATNPQPSLRINGTIVEWRRIGAHCLARNIKYKFGDDCFGKHVTIKFYGKVHNTCLIAAAGKTLPNRCKI